MVWAGFVENKRTSIAVVKGNQDRFQYLETLQTYLLSFTIEYLSVTWTFVQDGAPSHRALEMKKQFCYERITVLEWPPYSPELNRIENLLGIMARQFYAGQKQFDTVGSLKQIINMCWNDVSQKTLVKPSSSMQDRCIKVLHCNSKNIPY